MCTRMLIKMKLWKILRAFVVLGVLCCIIIYNYKHKRQTRSVILASWFTYDTDPQRGIYVSKGIDYIWNFYATARYLKLNVVIFHDHLSNDFVSKYTTETILFERIVPIKSFCPNDLRFIIYKNYVEKHPTYDWILMTDASDVFFNNDPLSYMGYHKQDNLLYMSPDTGTFGSNSWMTATLKRCYPDRVKSWKNEWKLQIYNCGVWGGYKPVVLCLLRCIQTQFEHYLKGRGLCDMAAVNWCAHFGNCADEKDLSMDNVKSSFVNAFREQCNNSTYSIIHNKCPGTEGLIRLGVVKGTIEYNPRKV